MYVKYVVVCVLMPVSPEDLKNGVSENTGRVQVKGETCHLLYKKKTMQPIQYKNKDLLQNILVYLLFLSASNKEWKEPFIFVQGADTQLGLFREYMTVTTDPLWAEEIRLAELAVKKVNEMRPKPKFYVICGDLCHDYYGTVRVTHTTFFFKCISF